MKLEDFLTPYTKVNSKWIKGLNIRSETIKVLEKIIGSTHFDKSQKNILSESPPRVMEIKTKINKWDLIKLRLHSCLAMPHTQRQRRGPSKTVEAANLSLESNPISVRDA